MRRLPHAGSGRDLYRRCPGELPSQREPRARYDHWTQARARSGRRRLTGNRSRSAAKANLRNSQMHRHKSLVRASLLFGPMAIALSLLLLLPASKRENDARPSLHHHLRLRVFAFAIKFSALVETSSGTSACLSQSRFSSVAMRFSAFPSHDSVRQKQCVLKVDGSFAEG